VYAALFTYLHAACCRCCNAITALLQAVKGAKAFGAAAPEVPAEPTELHDPTDKGMGVLTVVNIQLEVTITLHCY
jgi:hypothetical protein